MLYSKRSTHFWLLHVHGHKIKNIVISDTFIERTDILVVKTFFSIKFHSENKN